jgi:hypothetical protein
MFRQIYIRIFSLGIEEADPLILKIYPLLSNVLVRIKDCLNSK